MSRPAIHCGAWTLRHQKTRRLRPIDNGVQGTALSLDAVSLTGAAVVGPAVLEMTE
jgi:hypothetical protein